MVRIAARGQLAAKSRRATGVLALRALALLPVLTLTSCTPIPSWHYYATVDVYPPDGGAMSHELQRSIVSAAASVARDFRMAPYSPDERKFWHPPFADAAPTWKLLAGWSEFGELRGSGNLPATLTVAARADSSFIRIGVWDFEHGSERQWVSSVMEDITARSKDRFGSNAVRVHAESLGPDFSLHP